MSDHLLHRSNTLRQAIEKLNRLSGSSMTLFVVDDDDRLRGTLTDGDIRRALLAGITLSDPVEKAANARFRAIHGDISAESVKKIRDFRQQGLSMIPRVGHDGRIIEIIDLKQTPARLPLSALIMAGGKGERLRPLTDDTPKPLLRIEGKCIIDYNIEALAAAGITDITVATRHLADKIIKHFSSRVAGVNVKCVREDSPLGTIGAASLVEHKPGKSTLVMNSDIITSISFEEMYLRHIDSGADITIAAVPYQVAVPFAILSVDGDKVNGLQEKPSYSHYANAGIYLFKNEILDTIKPDTKIDATDLIGRTIESGGKVTYFPINGTWIDVGTPTDFKQAAELIRHHRAMKN